MDLIKPPRLRNGDTIGLVAPASPPIQDGVIEGAVRYLEGHGFPVKTGANLARRYGHFAGTDEERASDLNAMVADRSVRAIFCLRGGYGTLRILPLINYRALQRNPKIICGFSDITGLQLAIYRKTGLITFSGAMPGVEFWRNVDPWTEEQFWRALTSNKKLGALLHPEGQQLMPLRGGRVDGSLLGGNLALVTALLGTPFSPSFREALLLLEDVGEEPYRVDRMLTQLRNAGILRRILGMVLGAFTHCEAKAGRPHFTIEEVLEQAAQWVAGPVARNLQYGHIPKKLTLPLGVRARLDAKRGRLEILESALA